MSSRDLALLRRADMGDARIDVWLHQPSRQYYVSVSMQGTLRRTLKPVNEAEAWLNFDSFRRLAALGEVGRPVLLGQLNAAATGTGSDAGATAGWGGAGVGSAGVHGNTGSAAVSASSGAAPALRAGGQDLRTIPVPQERLAAADEVDEMDLERVRQAREAYASATGGAGAGTGTRVLPLMPAPATLAPGRPPPEARSAAASAEASTAVGQAVETLRRERIGDEVARLVWSADSGQFTASLTRQGRVVDMLRSPDRQVAVTAFDDLVRQARARAVASAAH